jgi:ribonuclease R
VDGLVHVSGLRDDFYHFSEETQSLVGERTRRRFRIGDRLKVVLERVDEEKRRVDFVLEEAEQPPRQGKKRR